MIRVEAWIRPHQIDAMKAALRDAGASGVTASDVTVLSSAAGGVRGSCTKLEAVVHDERVERVLQELQRASRPAGGGCEVWLTRVEQAVRIRTGEIDEAAIW